MINKIKKYLDATIISYMVLALIFTAILITGANENVTSKFMYLYLGFMIGSYARKIDSDVIIKEYRNMIDDIRNSINKLSEVIKTDE